MRLGDEVYITTLDDEVFSTHLLSISPFLLSLYIFTIKPCSEARQRALPLVMAITQLFMHYRLLIGITFAVLCLTRGTAAAKVIGMDTFKANRHVSSSRYQKRATISGPLAETATGNAYFLNITIGTPGQSNLLAIDTGSSDTWVFVHPDLAGIIGLSLVR